MELSKQEMDYFFHLQASDEKTSFTKCYPFVLRCSKSIFRTGNGIIQTGNKYLGVEVEGELKCGRMKQFGLAKTSAGAVATYWEQNWSTNYKCKLVSYQTPYSELVQEDSVKCLQEKLIKNRKK